MTDEPIVITREIFDHLPISVRVDAWILKREGRLTIVESIPNLKKKLQKYPPVEV